MAADVRAVITIRELIGVGVVEVIEKQRREKMKKLAILSPLVLLATTALAQDSTCILQPSCSQLGYTSAEADCGTAKVLRCPFDVSQVACLSGGSDGGSGGGAGGDGGDNYNPNDPNNEFEDAIILEITIADSNVGKKFGFKYGGGNIVVDCGNGTIIKSGTGSDIALKHCIYDEAGTYIFKAKGPFTSFDGYESAYAGEYGIYSVVTDMLKLDKSGIKKLTRVCGSKTIGIIPPLPSTLVDATEMFKSCSLVEGVIPKLPSGLTNGSYMFYSCQKLAGNIPALPSGLTNGNYMFYTTARLSGQIPALPSGLTHADYMFGLLFDIDSTVPLLPESLVSAKNMFLNNDGLKGVVQDFSTLPNLTTYTDMFSGTGITQADNPSWPAEAW